MVLDPITGEEVHLPLKQSADDDDVRGRRWWLLRRSEVPVDAVSGLVAGCAATLIVHPLDLIKVRLQVDNSSRSHLGGIVHVVNDLRRSQNPLKEAYRGLVPNIFGNMVSWGAYFYWYEKIKIKAQEVTGRPVLGFTDYLVSAGLAGGITSLFTNPIWVVKTRMLSTNSQYTGAYTSMYEGLKRIRQEEGIKGFYRGFVPSLLGVGHGAVQLMMYEEMKKWYLRGPAVSSSQLENSEPSDLSTLQYITFSATSKIGASLVMYPTQVIRSRLQRYDADNVYFSMRDVIFRTAKEEGILGFYKGLVPNLFRVVPATWVVTRVVLDSQDTLLSPVEAVARLPDQRIFASTEAIYVLSTHFGDTERERLQSALRDRGATIVDSVADAGIVLVNLESALRAAMELRRCGLTAQVLRAGAAPLVVKIDWVRRCIASGRIEDRSRYILNIQSASMSSLSATPPVTPVKRRRRKHTDEDDSSSLSDPASPTPSTKVPKTRKKRVAKDLSAVAAASREDSDLPELDPIYLQKLSCYRPHPLICPNEDLAKILAQIRHLRDLDGNDTSVRAYSSAIASIRSYPYKIKSGKEVKRLNGCGAKTLKLVNEFLETGAIESETAKADTAEYEAIERLQEIWGVGGRTASSWVREKGWKSIEDVQREGMSSLTRHQEAGVRYYQDLKVKLNREQVAAIAETVTRYAKDIHPDALSLVGGSYRRGNTSHADVDMLLTVPNNKPGEHYTFLQELIKRLQKANLITEVLTITSNLRKGELLDLALVVWSTVPNVSGVPLAHFRVDLICADWKVIGPAVVGWTGGTTFERDLRIRAKKLGYKFHSSGLLDLKTNKLVDCTADTMEAAERKVFEILQLPYYDPELRNTG